MTKLMLNQELNLYELNGQVFCSSRQVAEEFDRQHGHILRLIDEFTQSTSGVSTEFTSLNFQESKYKDGSGKWNKEYIMTKDGFTLLAMEIKGKKARQFKEAYINRFNQMESIIKNRLLAKLEFPELTENIKLAHDPAKHYHYSNEADLINRIVLGMSAKQFRLANGLPKDAPIRDLLTLEQIEAIQRLQKFDTGLVVAVPDYDQRKQILMDYYSKVAAPKLLAK